MSNRAGADARRHEYDALLPLFTELAALEKDDARYKELRDRLVTEHLPIAEHIARRFRHRGEPHDDLFQVSSIRGAERERVGPRVELDVTDGDRTCAGVGPGLCAEIDECCAAGVEQRKSLPRMHPRFRNGDECDR